MPPAQELSYVNRCMSRSSPVPRYRRSIHIYPAVGISKVWRKIRRSTPRQAPHPHQHALTTRTNKMTTRLMRSVRSADPENLALDRPPLIAWFGLSNP